MGGHRVRKPRLERIGRQDRGHAVLKRRHNFVGRGREDRAVSIAYSAMA